MIRFGLFNLAGLLTEEHLLKNVFRPHRRKTFTTFEKYSTIIVANGHINYMRKYKQVKCKEVEFSPKELAKLEM